MSDDLVPSRLILRAHTHKAHLTRWPQGDPKPLRDEATTTDACAMQVAPVSAEAWA